jgi:PhnB protein
VTVKPVPEGYHAVTPYLIIRGANQAIDFYKQAFGAVEVFRMADPSSNKIGHAEIKIRDSHLMLADEYPEMGFVGPEAVGGSPVSLLLYVDNVDVTFQNAIVAGAKAIKPVEDQFYGDRSGTLRDPFGHVWTVATHKEDVSFEEMKRRAAKKFSNA